MISRYLVAQNQGRRDALGGRREWPSLREDYYMSRRLTLFSVIALVLCIGVVSRRRGEACPHFSGQHGLAARRAGPGLGVG